MSKHAEDVGIVVNRDAGTTGLVPNHRHCQSTVCSVYGHQSDGSTHTVLANLDNQEHLNYIFPNGWQELFVGNTSANGRNNISHDIASLVRMINIVAGQNEPLCKLDAYDRLQFSNLSNWQDHFTDNTKPAQDIMGVLNVTNDALGQILDRLNYIHGQTIGNGEGTNDGGVLGKIEVQINNLRTAINDIGNVNGLQNQINAINSRLAIIENILTKLCGKNLNYLINLENFDLINKINILIEWMENGGPGVETWTVTFAANEGSFPGLSGTTTTVSIPKGQSFSQAGKTTPSCTRSGYDFVKWQTSNYVSFNYDSPITGNVTYYAQWRSASSQTCTVTFNANGGSFGSSTTRAITISKGMSFSSTGITVPTCTYAGHTFLSWKTSATGGALFSSDTPINSDVTYYAQWEEISQGEPPTVQLWEDGPEWADRNIGAEHDYDFGEYFMYGSIDGYRRENNVWVGPENNFSFDAAHCSIYGQNKSQLVSDGVITNDNVLTQSHDAATQKWGPGWKIPSRQDWLELNNHCDMLRTEKDGVEGVKITGRGDYSDKSIFLPDAGCASGNGQASFNWYSSTGVNFTVDLDKVNSREYAYHGNGVETTYQGDINIRKIYVDMSCPIFWGLPIRPIKTSSGGGSDESDENILLQNGDELLLENDDNLILE